MPSDAVPGHFFCAFAQEFHQIRAVPFMAPRNKIAASREAAMRRSLRLATAVRIPIRPVRAALPLRMPMPARVGSTIAALAQSGRAPAYEAGGRGFESRMPRHWIAQLGRASVSDTESRGFESCSK